MLKTSKEKVVITQGKSRRYTPKSQGKSRHVYIGTNIITTKVTKGISPVDKFHYPKTLSKIDRT